MPSIEIVVNGLGFPRLPSFDKGTCPTLLEATEAKKVKAFIEALLYRTSGHLVTGSTQANRCELIMSPMGNRCELWEQTDLRWARAPQLMASLNANGEIIYSALSDLYLAAGGLNGVRIQSQTGGPGLLQLSVGMPGTQAGYTGHKSNAAPDNTIYLWP